MKHDVEPDFLSQLDAVFAQLSPQVVEEFYAAYRQWSTQQRITELRQRIDAVREQQADNEQRLRETQPSAIALAALARLQSNGVSDTALLDAMLERGESWLDQTMQRLDYFEQFDDFISDDYTKWCQGALEGAFDWIDSLRDSPEREAPVALEVPPAEEPSNNEDAGDVEALLLQRLATEDAQDDLSWQEAITLKQTAIKVSPPETAPAASDEQAPPAPEDVAQEAQAQAQIIEHIPQDEPAQSDQTETPVASDVASSTGMEEQIIPEEVFPVQDTAIPESELDQPALIEFAPIEEAAPGEDELHTGDDQPALIESAPIEEPSPTGSEIYTGDEPPAFVEFAAPTEVSPLEETPDHVTEQTVPAEITKPEDIPTPEDTVQNAENKLDEIEMSAPEEASSHYQQALSTGETITPARSTPQKRGLIGTLIWILTGK